VPPFSTFQDTFCSYPPKSEPFGTAVIWWADRLSGRVTPDAPSGQKASPDVKAPSDIRIAIMQDYLKRLMDLTVSRWVEGRATTLAAILNKKDDEERLQLAVEVITNFCGWMDMWKDPNGPKFDYEERPTGDGSGETYTVLILKNCPTIERFFEECGTPCWKGYAT